MDFYTARRLAAHITFRPDWTIKFIDPRNMGLMALFHPDADRHPGGAQFIVISVSYMALDTDDLHLPVERMRQRDSGSNRMIRIDDIDTAAQFYPRVLAVLLSISEHEDREFFRVDGVAPYHPHRPDGERAWRREGERTSSGAVTLPEDTAHSSPLSRLVI